MSSEVDPKLNEKVSDIATALEEAVHALTKSEPFDNSKIYSAVKKFDSRQDQADALCSAVQQANPVHKARDLNVPPLSINGEKAGTDWAALRAYVNIQGNNNSVIEETLFILPITQGELKNLKCNVLQPPGPQTSEVVTNGAVTNLDADPKSKLFV